MANSKLYSSSSFESATGTNIQTVMKWSDRLGWSYAEKFFRFGVLFGHNTVQNMRNSLCQGRVSNIKNLKSLDEIVPGVRLVNVQDRKPLSFLAPGFLKKS